ncbi:WYL domain-containing protein, partial [Streptomonospora algeriensis]
APGGAPPRSPTDATLTALSEAATQGRRVWIGYLDTEGRASSRIVEPARVEGGFLTAYDATRAAVHRFAVHRITGVADLDSS